MGERKLKPLPSLVEAPQENESAADQPHSPVVHENTTSTARPFWVYILALAIFAGMGFAISKPLKVYINDFLYYEVTDDAQISGRVSTVSAKVSGIITSVNFEDHSKVKKGDLLVQLDQREFRNHVNQLQAELSSVTATFWHASTDRERGKFLLERGYLTQNNFDALEAKYNEALGKVWSVQAQLDQAKLDLEYTEIRAPSDGTVGKRHIEPGMVIRPLQTLTSFVESKDRWIMANYKETQLQKMKVGQEVEIEVDSISGKIFYGKIESMSPGSGSTFALIPPDNATGNFTKIVQRVPIKIQFSPESIKGYEDRLMPGISVYSRVKVREKP